MGEETSSYSCFAFVFKLPPELHYYKAEKALSDMRGSDHPARKLLFWFNVDENIYFGSKNTILTGNSRDAGDFMSWANEARAGCPVLEEFLVGCYPSLKKSLISYEASTYWIPGITGKLCQKEKK
jgi:hypothetical protein